MFEKMSNDDLISLFATIKEQQEVATLANDSKAINRLISKELLIRHELNSRRTPAKEEPREIDGWRFDWIEDESMEERCCPLCGHSITCDGRAFARHLLRDKQKVERLTGRDFKGVDEVMDFLEWHGIKLDH